jgi:chemotaxis regulatin CheY-phosphate phosphatase CheZ
MPDDKKKARKTSPRKTPAKAEMNKSVSRDERLLVLIEQRFQQRFEFILEQQADAEERTAKLENVLTRLANTTLDRLDKLEDTVAALIDSQERLKESQEELKDAQQRTNEDLRNLIAVVDRYFSEGRNGESKS